MFADRASAGRQLAKRLKELHTADPAVLGLPRGGVVVAAEVARALHAPLDAVGDAVGGGVGTSLRV